MSELIEILRLIHFDLMVIGVVLIAFVIFKDCHGYSNTGIVDELKNIKSTIQNKQFYKREEKS